MPACVLHATAYAISRTYACIAVIAFGASAASIAGLHRGFQLMHLRLQAGSIGSTSRLGRLAQGQPLHSMTSVLSVTATQAVVLCQLASSSAQLMCVQLVFGADARAGVCKTIGRSGERL